jgi:hypothetical protein
MKKRKNTGRGREEEECRMEGREDKSRQSSGSIRGREGGGGAFQNVVDRYIIYGRIGRR